MKITNFNKLTILGACMFALAAYQTYTRELRGRFGEVTRRAEEPRQYWLGLALYYLMAIGFVGYSFYIAQSN